MIDKSIIQKAKKQSKENDYSSVWVLWDGGEYIVSDLNSEDMMVDGFEDVGEFINGEQIWLEE
jgi:hypothetical protein